MSILKNINVINYYCVYSFIEYKEYNIMTFKILKY